MSNKKALPRELDVVISISQAQTELATDMTLACLLTPDVDWQPSTRLKFYSDFAAFAEDIAADSSAYRAGVEFFSQPTRPQTLAVGRVFTASQVEAAGPPAVEAYTYVSFADEILKTQAAAVAVGKKIFGWLLDSSYRDGAAEQQALADYCSANLYKAAAFLCTNDATAKTADDDTNIAAVLAAAGTIASSVVYHDNAQYYPDAAYAAIALGVNYGLSDSTLTMKFKDLIGVDTVALTETELAAVEAKNCNTFTLIGNNSRTVRQGVQSAPTWYTDTYVNLSNFREELQVEVYNVFLRNRKIPYTRAGQMLIVAAIQKICEQYVRNGTFADRRIEDATTDTGYRIDPAFIITPAAIETATSSDRAARLAPPIQITAYLAGAMHKVAINVDVIQ